ncbi:MAG: indole-3-glycerol phosphate [Planctomycetota bacterium]|nr:MAG: indole-3-glycerol phosphate [Planctomycetota bacterium]
MLEKILAQRRKRLAEAIAAVPLREIRSRAKDQPPARDFRGALVNAKGLGLIAEIKRATPSKGDIAVNLDSAERARSYEAAGADCLSVLTEQDFFKGSLDDLRAARAACVLPVLRKDFIVDEYQVWEARAHGADAVLLIVAALGKRTAEFRAIAKEAGLAALVEVHDETELEHAGDAELVGVNNRNLQTLAMDLTMMERVLPMSRAAVRVAESGLKTREDAVRARTAGARALLVGEEVVKQADPRGRIRELKLL